MQEQKYEQAVIECKKWRNLIKTGVGRRIIVLSKKQLDHVRTAYGEIINAPEISNGKDEIDHVWNESDNENFPDKKSGKYHNIFLTDYDRRLIITRNISRDL